jgi:hypothetical protein
MARSRQARASWLRCMGTTSRADHLATFADIDMSLDPFPQVGLGLVELSQILKHPRALYQHKDCIGLHSQRGVQRCRGSNRISVDGIPALRFRLGLRLNFNSQIEDYYANFG